MGRPQGGHASCRLGLQAPSPTLRPFFSGRKLCSVFLTKLQVSRKERSKRRPGRQEGRTSPLPAALNCPLPPTSVGSPCPRPRLPGGSVRTAAAARAAPRSATACPAPACDCCRMRCPRPSQPQNFRGYRSPFKGHLRLPNWDVSGERTSGKTPPLPPLALLTHLAQSGRGK